MLTDTKLRNLKPQEKLYKVNGRDGLYVAVTAAGSISFRYNYSINGRQETITFGRYGVGGIIVAEPESAWARLKRWFQRVSHLSKRKPVPRHAPKGQRRLMRGLRNGCVGMA